MFHFDVNSGTVLWKEKKYFFEKKNKTLEWSLKRTSNTLVKRPWSPEQTQHNPRSQQSLGNSPLQVQTGVLLYPLTTGRHTGLHTATPGRVQLYWLWTRKQNSLSAYVLGNSQGWTSAAVQHAQVTQHSVKPQQSKPETRGSLLSGIHCQHAFGATAYFAIQAT